MEEKVAIILDASDIIPIIECCISAVLLLATIISVICAFKAYSHQKERSKKEAACRLARTYADEVLSQYQVVDSVFDKSNLWDYIKKVFPMDQLNSFSLQEMLDLSMASGIKYDELISKMETFDPLCILDAITANTNSILERNILNIAYSSTDKETGERTPINSPFLQSQFLDIISHLLNTLEWFSMNCRYGLADEELLYQSLHQTFLSMVWMLYYFISRNNTRNEDKYYTNTIWLFKMWKERLSEQTQRTAIEQQEAMESMRTAREKYDNAGCTYAGKALK